MEIVKVTDNANFVRVKLGEIKPNRFRKLDRYPLEHEVLDALKQSINDTGFWNNLQGIRNEKNEIELRFGHHRLAAGLDLFGPDYEVAVEIVEFNGVNSLQEALAYENSIHRNKVAHCNEMVSVRREWWDDVVFEQYPTWDDAVEDRCNFFGDAPSDFRGALAVLEKYFGKQNEGGIGAYSTCVGLGVGTGVLLKMLPGETKTSIEQSLAALPLTVRAKRGLELQAEEERVKAEAKRQEAARIAAEQAKIEREAQEEAARIKEEQDRLAVEQRKAEAEAKAARDAEEQKAIAERQRILREKQAEVAAKQSHAKVEKEARIKVAQVAKAKVESDARQSDIRAKQKEDVIQRREWYDARASEVFDRQAHGAAFRMAVSHSEISPFLTTESLLPFAKAIRSKLEENNGEVTADKITNLVHQNFKEFKNTMKLKEQEAAASKKDPNLELINMLDKAVTDGNRFSGTLAELESVMREYNFTAVEGPSAGKFMDVLSKVIARSAFFNPRSYK